MDSVIGRWRYAIFAGAILTIVGCGQGDVAGLKSQLADATAAKTQAEETAANQKKIAEAALAQAGGEKSKAEQATTALNTAQQAKATAEAQAQQAAKDAADSKMKVNTLETQVGDLKKQLADALKGTPDVAGLNTKINDLTNRIAKLTTDLKDSDTKLKTQEETYQKERADLLKTAKENEALAKEAKSIKVANEELKNTIDDYSKKQAATNDEIVKLKKQMIALELKMPNPTIARKPEDFDRIGGEVVILYHPGKLKEAKQVCDLLNIKILNDELDSRILGKWNSLPTDELLKMVDIYRTVIKGLEPQGTPKKAKPKEKNGATNPVYDQRSGLQSIFAGLRTTPAPSSSTPDSTPNQITFSPWIEKYIDLEDAKLAFQQVSAIRNLTSPEPIRFAIIDSSFDVKKLKQLIAGAPITISETYYVYNTAESERRNVKPGKAVKTDSLSAILNIDDDDELPVEMTRTVHGTHCAGIALSILAKVYRKTLRPIEVILIAVQEDKNSNSIATAIDQARASNADVVSMSIVYRPAATDFPSDTLFSSVKKILASRNTVFVCAAGNDGKEIGQQMYLEPVCYGIETGSIHVHQSMKVEIIGGEKRFVEDIESQNPSEHVNPDSMQKRLIVVGSFGSSGTKSSHSNRSTSVVDLLAPGGDYKIEDKIAPSRIYDKNFQFIKDKTAYNIFVPNDHGVNSAIPSAISLRGDVKFDFDSKSLYSGSLVGTSQATPHVAAAVVLAMAHPLYQQKNSDDMTAELLERMSRAQKADFSTKENGCKYGLLKFGYLKSPVVSEGPAPVVYRGYDESFGKGYALFWDGDYHQAIKYLQAGAKSQTYGYDSLFYAAFACANLGDFDQASKFLEDVLAESPAIGSVSPNWGRVMENIQGPNRLFVERIRKQYGYGSRNLHPPGAAWWKGWDPSYFDKLAPLK